MYETILVATDGSPPAEKAVHLAGELAAAHDAKLIVAHVIDPQMSREDLRRFAETENLASGYPVRRGKDAIIMPHGEVPLPTTTFGGETIDWAAAEETIGQRFLQQAVEIASAEGARRIEAVVGRGDAAEEILHVAERRKADAIVLGSRGQGGLADAIFGSVSKKVAQRAASTCVTVS